MDENADQINHDDLRRLHSLHVEDQNEQFVRQMAAQIATYYQALAAGEIPDELLHDLTMQYASIWWRKLLLPDAPGCGCCG